MRTGKYHTLKVLLNKSNLQAMSGVMMCIQKCTCSRTSSWECSVSKSFTSSCSTCGCRSWWHVLIWEGNRQTDLKHFLSFLLYSLVNQILPYLLNYNVQNCSQRTPNDCMTADWAKYLPHPARPNGWECDLSAAESNEVQTQSSQPTLTPPLLLLETWHTKVFWLQNNNTTD